MSPCPHLHHSPLTLPLMQVLTSLCVSTGCLSHGLCLAYTSSALPSIMAQDRAR